MQMHIPSQGTLVVTGAAGGIGHGFVTQFLRSTYATTHHCIYIHHPAAPGSLSSYLSHTAPRSHSYEVLPLDLSSLAAIRRFTVEINARIASRALLPIRGLLLIAGGIFVSKIAEDGINFTTEGREMTFTVNYLANFALVGNLLGSMDHKDGARIIFMSSTTHDPAWVSNRYGHFNKEEHKILFRSGSLGALAEGRQEKVGKGDEFGAAMRRYGTSKLLMNMFMYELQRRLSSSQILSNISMLALDPGVVGGTSLFTHFPIYLYFILNYILILLQPITVYIFPNGRLRTAEKTGSDVLYACFDEKTLGKVPGALYLNGTEIADSSAESHDVKKQGELWRETMKVAREGFVDGAFENLEIA